MTVFNRAMTLYQTDSWAQKYAWNESCISFWVKWDNLTAQIHACSGFICTVQWKSPSISCPNMWYRDWHSKIDVVTLKKHRIKTTQQKCLISCHFLLYLIHYPIMPIQKSFFNEEVSEIDCAYFSLPAGTSWLKFHWKEAWNKNYSII